MIAVHDQEEIKIFLDELEENLNFLDEAIITLEENPGNPETLEDIFRVAHTIKGSAGFLDLKNLVALGHAMENVFQEFKTGSIPVTTGVIDTVLQCKDAIGKIGHLLGKGEDSSVIQTDALIEKINQFLAGKSKPDAHKEAHVPAAKVAPATVEDASAFKPEDLIENAILVRVWISPAEVAPSIRAFLVHKRLSEVGEVVKQVPSEEDMDQDEFQLPPGREIRYWIKSENSPEDIENAAKADLVDKVGIISSSALKELIEHNSGIKEGDASQVKAEIETSDSVRIPVHRLDVMLNLVGELVIANSGFMQIQETLRNHPELANLFKDVRDRTKDLVRISSEIQGLVMNSRLVPISSVFNRFKRFVRDYSSKSGKKIRLTMAGESTELDKKITDEIIKPLTHLVRNSLDHGLESPGERISAGKSDTGTLHLEAYQEGNYINIIIQDDGKGLNYNKIIEKAISNGLISAESAMGFTEDDIKNLIFRPGFSTKDEVDEMSGRGVGMDVVKSSVENLNGSLIIESKPEKGTMIMIKLPLTLAILNALIVKVGREKYCIPMSAIVETQKVSTKNFLTVDNNEMVRLRDKLIPVIKLENIFPSEEKTGSSGSKDEVKKPDTRSAARKEQDEFMKEYPVIVVDFHNTPIAILVDQFLSRQEVVIKSLAEHYRTIDGISGASILGDGSIILIIDVHGVIQLFRTQRSRTLGETSTAQAAVRQAVTEPRKVQPPIVVPAPPIPAQAVKPATPAAEVKPIVKPAPPQKTVAAGPKKPLSLEDLSQMTEAEFEELEELEISKKYEPTPEETKKGDVGETVFFDEPVEEKTAKQAFLQAEAMAVKQAEAVTEGESDFFEEPIQELPLEKAGALTAEEKTEPVSSGASEEAMEEVPPIPEPVRLEDQPFVIIERDKVSEAALKISTPEAEAEPSVEEFKEPSIEAIGEAAVIPEEEILMEELPGEESVAIENIEEEAAVSEYPAEIPEEVITEEVQPEAAEQITESLIEPIGEPAEPTSEAAEILEEEIPYEEAPVEESITMETAAVEAAQAPSPLEDIFEEEVPVSEIPESTAAAEPAEAAEATAEPRPETVSEPVAEAVEILEEEISYENLPVEEPSETETTGIETAQKPFSVENIFEEEIPVVEISEEEFPESEVSVADISEEAADKGQWPEQISLEDTDQKLLSKKGAEYLALHESPIEEVHPSAEYEPEAKGIEEDIEIGIVEDETPENYFTENLEEGENFEFSVSPDNTIEVMNSAESEEYVSDTAEQRLEELKPEVEPEKSGTENQDEGFHYMDLNLEEIESEMKEMEDMDSKKETIASPEETAKPEEVKEDEGELSEFEKMKRMIDSGEYADEEEDLYQTIALDHFKKDDYELGKLHDLLDGKDQELVKSWLIAGNQKAIEGIKSLTGHENIFPGQTRAKKYSIDKLNTYIDRFKGDDLPVIGLTLPMLPIHGMIYFILTHNNARNMAAMLYKTAQMQAPETIDFEPLMEVTNILGSAFTNTLTQLTDIPIEPGIPQILENNELLVDSMEEQLKRAKDSNILYIENEFLWGEKEVLAELIMMIPRVL